MEQVSEWVLVIMDKLDLVGVSLMMFLENIFPPIPSELIMPAAGFAAATGQMNLFAVNHWCPTFILYRYKARQSTFDTFDKSLW